MSTTKDAPISAEVVTECRTVTGEYLPVSPCKVNLSNPENIRQEMARVYREARANKLESSDANV